MKNYGWIDLLKDGVVELISTMEEESIMIAMKPKDLMPAEGIPKLLSN